MDDAILKLDPVRVLARVRPASSPSSRTSVSVHDQRTVSVGGQVFTLDHVANQQTTQEQMFEEAGRQIVDACLLGYNGTILTYGQTNSGKTYTIFGAYFH